MEMNGLQKLKTNFEQKLQQFEVNQTDMLKKLHLTIDENRPTACNASPINDMDYLQKKPMVGNFLPKKKNRFDVIIN